ncbi:hypothetical protein LZ32DRAFT_623455 [Colletotrichum eremochloae]|nr:hypothetical protein LZ32DRAFT_623455 [Colletotrichum eremochloae]
MAAGMSPYVGLRGKQAPEGQKGLAQARIWSRQVGAKVTRLLGRLLGRNGTTRFREQIRWSDGARWTEWDGTAGPCESANKGIGRALSPDLRRPKARRKVADVDGGALTIMGDLSSRHHALLASVANAAQRWQSLGLRDQLLQRRTVTKAKNA